MTSVTEPVHAGNFLLSLDDDGNLSRDRGTIKSGAGVVLPGTVMGQITLGAATAAAKSGGNTGNGTITMDGTTPVLANALAGIYTARCTVAGTNSATFRITGPKGDVLGDAAFSGSGASLSFADRIKFTITDGATDFIVGDGFDITVASGTNKWVPCVGTALDGSQNPGAVNYARVDATSADVVATLVTRHAELNGSQLIYDASLTKATVNAQLAALGMPVR